MEIEFSGARQAGRQVKWNHVVATPFSDPGLIVIGAAGLEVPAPVVCPTLMM